MKKTIEQVVTETLRNVANYPPNVAPHVLGTDMSRPIDAVVAALKAEGYTDREVWTSNDQDTIIKIIQHMAKMGGLSVTVTKSS